jgi:hypothetical protein
MRRAVIIVMLFALGACSSISVESDWDTSVDFSQFRTFGLIDNREPTVNRLVDDRIRAAISADLHAKGLRHRTASDV